MTSQRQMRGSAHSLVLSVLARRTPNAVIVTDPDGRIVWVNDGFTRTTGYRADEVLGRVPGHFLQGPDTDPEAVALMSRALARQEGFQVEVVNYAKNGRPYWIDIDCQPVAENGDLTHFIAIQTDVTKRKTLEQNLLRAERVAKVGHWSLDLVTEERFWSDETYRIFELEVGSPVPSFERILQRFHPTDAPDVRALLKNAAARGESFGYRKRLCLNGRIKWIEVRAECELGSDGSAKRQFGTVQDVTELVDAHETRRCQEDRFRAMTDTIPGVAYQWVHWPDGREGFTYLSPNAWSVLGHSVESLLADWNLLAIEAQDRARFHESIRAAVQQRQDWSFVGRRRHPNGELRWIRASSKLIGGPSGELIYNGLVIDITDETKAQEALRDSESRMRTLIDAIPAAIAYFDRDGVFRYANRTRRGLAGNEHDDLTGCHWHSVYDLPTVKYLAPYVERALNGTALTYSVTQTDSAGGDEERVYDTTLVPDIDPEGGVRGLFSIAFDVTDYKLREQQLLQAREAALTADRAKSVFLATMSHELRTPLNAINGYAEIMAQGMFGPLGNARYQGYAQDILDSGRYLRDLIEGVLDLSRVEAGKSELAIEPVAVDAAVADVLRMLAGKARQAGVVLQPTCPEGLWVQADARAFKQVLVNVLDNAIKYSPPGGQVALLATTAPDGTSVEVSDAGPGIAPNDVARVVQPFVRGETQTPLQASTTPGVGIGLAIVKRYLEAMGGTLTIDSAVGCGTRIELRLPASEAAQRAVAQTA